VTGAQVRIHAGVCGFVTEATADSPDRQHVEITVLSPCPKMQELAAHLPVLDAYTEIGAGFEGQFWQAVRKSVGGCCSGCAVPVGLWKAMQVAAGLALPAAVDIQLTRG